MIKGAQRWFGRRGQPAITSLYCSQIGHDCTNAQMLEVNRQRLFPSCRSDTVELYEKLLGKEPERRRKFAVVPYDGVLDLDIHGKFELFRRASVALMKDAGCGVLRAAQLEAAQIDFLIICYMAGKALPSLNALIVHELALRPDVVSLTLGDMGCSAGVAALDLAARLLRGHPRPARALVMALEPVTSLFHNDDEHGSVVGNTLFGEGCAALIVSSHREPALYHIGPSQRILHADERAIGAITLASRDNGPMICLSREIPEVAAEAVEMNLRRLVPRLLPLRDKLDYALTRRRPRWQRRVDRWAIHPGGTAVLKGMQSSLKLADADVGPSYRVFDERSNMSSPSVLYALDNIERATPAPGERVLMLSFGSGFKVNSMLLTRGKRPHHGPSERSAVVVGGTSGIGLACARMLQEKGYRLFIGSRRVSSGDDFERVPHATYLPLDVTDADSTSRFSEDVWRSTYGIDVLVLSSGVAGDALPIGREDPHNIARIIDTNLTGAIRVLNTLVPRVRQHGHVFVLNSLLGQIPLMSNATYCASKAGLRHLCAALRLELRRSGRKVKIHELYPSYVNTPMFQGVRAGARTFGKPVPPARVARQVGDILAGRAARGGFTLARDRLIAGAYRLMPEILSQILAAM